MGNACCTGPPPPGGEDGAEGSHRRTISSPRVVGRLASFVYGDSEVTQLRAKVQLLNLEIANLKASSQPEIDRLKREIEQMRAARVETMTNTTGCGCPKPDSYPHWMRDLHIPEMLSQLAVRLAHEDIENQDVFMFIHQFVAQHQQDPKRMVRRLLPGSSSSGSHSPLASPSSPMSPARGTVGKRSFDDDEGESDSASVDGATSAAATSAPSLQGEEEAIANIGENEGENDFGDRDSGRIPPLNIICIVVGSRGDVQPFIAFGMRLQEQYGHRVRIATHAMFHTFVTSHGLDFYPLKGDPEALMQYMIHHPNLITFNPKEISIHIKEMWDIFESAWHACSRNPDGSAYYPDVMVANPPVQIHIHICEKLLIPLQILFTFPWTKTKAFMCPMISFGNLYSNARSYEVVDEIMWMGLGPLINKFRRKVLGLPKMGGKGAHLLKLLRVPYIYCMSPNLVHKPSDWGPHIDVVGNLEIGTHTLTPQQEVSLTALKNFLASGPPPMYIGFGSIVIDKPQVFSRIVVDAVTRARVRTILHQGWMRLGEGCTVGPDIFLLKEPVPHEWLFPQCSAVCHHGGAGTTATGLRFGRPTVVCYFFGDQEFWGQRVAAQNVGPTPMAAKKLTAEALATAIHYCYKPEVIANARALGEKMSQEDGLGNAANAFHRKLPMVDGKWLVSTYENQRYYPWKGWSKDLLPTDRSRWSDSTGVIKKKRDFFYLPRGWNWLGDWSVDQSGECDAEGFQYAFDFPSKYHGKNSIKDCVRRRRWIRARVYNGISCPLAAGGPNASALVPGSSSLMSISGIGATGVALAGRSVNRSMLPGAGGSGVSGGADSAGSTQRAHSPMVNSACPDIVFTVYVNVKEADNLIGTLKGAYVEVMLRRGMETILQSQKTRQLKDNPPRWNVSLVYTAQAEDILVFLCYDEGKKLFGKVEVPVIGLNPNQTDDRWIPFQTPHPKYAPEGRLHLIFDVRRHGPFANLASPNASFRMGSIDFGHGFGSLPPAGFLQAPNNNGTYPTSPRTTSPARLDAFNPRLGAGGSAANRSATQPPPRSVMIGGFGTVTSDDDVADLRQPNGGNENSLNAMYPRTTNLIAGEGPARDPLLEPASLTTNATVDPRVRRLRASSQPPPRLKIPPRASQDLGSNSTGSQLDPPSANMLMPTSSTALSDIYRVRSDEDTTSPRALAAAIKMAADPSSPTSPRVFTFATTSFNDFKNDPTFGDQDGMPKSEPSGPDARHAHFAPPPASHSPSGLKPLPSPPCLPTYSRLPQLPSPADRYSSHRATPTPLGGTGAWGTWGSPNGPSAYNAPASSTTSGTVVWRSSQQTDPRPISQNAIPSSPYAASPAPAPPPTRPILPPSSAGYTTSAIPEPTKTATTATTTSIPTGSRSRSAAYPTSSHVALPYSSSNGRPKPTTTTIATSRPPVAKSRYTTSGAPSPYTPSATPTFYPISTTAPSGFTNYMPPSPASPSPSPATPSPYVLSYGDGYSYPPTVGSYRSNPGGSSSWGPVGNGYNPGGHAIPFGGSVGRDYYYGNGGAMTPTAYSATSTPSSAFWHA